MPNPEGAIGLLGNPEQSFNPYASALVDADERTTEQQLKDLLTFGAPAAVAGFAETVGTSLGLTDEESFRNQLMTTFPKFGTFYRNSADAAKVVGDIGGSMLPGMLALKAMRVGGKLADGLSDAGKASKLLKALFVKTGKFDEELNALRARDRFLAEKLGVSDFKNDAERASLARQAITTKVTDILKENAAFEAGVFATMSDSQVLFPDEFSGLETFGLVSAIPLTLAGAGAAITARQIRASAQLNSRIAEIFKNPEALPFDALVSQPGVRDVGVTIATRSRNTLEGIKNDLITQQAGAATTKEASDLGIGISNINRQIIATEGEMKNFVKKMGKDTVVKGFTKSTDLSDAQKLTVMDALRRDEAVLLGTESIEDLPGSYAGVLARYEDRDNFAEKLVNDLTAKVIEVDEHAKTLAKKSSDGVIDTNDKQLVKLKNEAENIRKQLDRVRSYHLLVLEGNGDLANARIRKPIFQDNPGPITIQQATVNEPKIFSVTAAADPIYGTNKKLIGVTSDFEVLIPEAEKNTISGINTIKILKPEETKQTEFFRFTLKDMGQDWAPINRDGVIKDNRGGALLRGLTPEIKSAVKSWIGASNRSPIRSWFKEGAPEAKQLYDAHEPLRQRLREIADADGTIPLFRGESSSETKFATNDVVSMTSDPGVAKAFGTAGNIVVRRVPVDDVIMIVGGLDEFEFIVKGNTKRSVGEQINRANFESLTLFQRSAAYGGLQRAVNDWKPGVKINIAPGSHHTKLDAVLALHSARGQQVLKDITFPPQFKNLDDVEFASIAGKFEEYARLRKVTDGVRGGVIRLNDDQIINHEDIRKMLNLPGTGFEQVHPMVRAFEALYQEGKTTLTQAVNSLDDFKRLVQGADDLPLGTPYRPQQMRLSGGMLQPPPPPGKSLPAKTPVMLIKRPVTQEAYQRDNLVKAMRLERARVVTEMSRANEKGANLVFNLYKTLEKHAPIVKAAQDVGSLATGTTRGTALISQPSFAAGENPAIIAAHQIEILTDKAFRKEVGEIFETIMPTLKELKNPANRADLTLTGLYVHARRQGWDVKPDFEELGEGLVGLKLRDTGKNKDRYQKLFGQEMPDGENIPFMPSIGNFTGGKIQYKPLGLTPRVARYADELDAISGIVHANDGFIKELSGRGVLSKRERWVPPRNFAGETIVYVMTPTGELIAPATGRTVQEARRNAQQISEAVGGETMFVDQSTDLQRYFDIHDKAFAEMLDFSDPLLQTGSITGRQVGPNVADIGPGLLDEITSTIERRFESILRRGRAIYFEPQIALARKRLQGSGIPNPKAGTSPWQMYLASLFGNPLLNQNQLTGMTYFGIEKIYDNVLNVLFDRTAAALNPKNAAKIAATAKEDKVYKQLSEQLGPFNPFENTLDMINRTRNTPLPANMKKHMAALTSFTTLLTLRLFEVGHSLLNLTSLAATTPAVVSWLKKTDLEKSLGVTGQEQYLARVGAFGADITGDIAMWSPSKALVSGTHFMFSEEGRDVWKRAADAGFFKQQVSEIFSTLTGPTEGYWKSIATNATNYASFLSDKSEELSRGIAFMTGYNLAKKAGGIKDENLLFAFSHHFANQVIGDFSPNNKPRIFQGAVGMPLGLFTTFTWNYFQRLFGYIENKQTRALATQFATQASVFGAQTIPGFNQYMDVFFSNYDGTANPIDAMNNRFGPEFTEAFMTGGVSVVGKLFGLDDMPALYTRGDVNVRNIPTLATATNTPVVAMFRDFFNATRETAGMLRARGGFDDDQMAEIIQQYSTNRALRNVASLYTGYKIDRNGQVIDNPGTLKDFIKGEANNNMSIISAFMGLNTVDQSRKIETFRRIRATDMTQRALKGDLRASLRAAGRAGEITPEFLNKNFAEYIRNGGSPENYINWVAENFLTSQVDKTALRLIEIINSPNKSSEMLRLMSVLSPTPSSLPKMEGLEP